jgi:twitching motility protein PilI
MELRALARQPFELLLELERRARAAAGVGQSSQESVEEWVGIAFRMGHDRFIADRADVREVLPIPSPMTRVPGAKPWLRGVANVRGQLLTIVDLRGFLGSGGVPSDRRARVLVLASRDVPTGIVVDEVFGFRRFPSTDYDSESPAPEIRCEQYLRGAYRSGDEVWSRFDFPALLEDEHFLNVGDDKKA